MLSSPRWTSCHKELYYTTAEQDDFPHIFNNDLGIWKWERKKVKGNFLQSPSVSRRGKDSEEAIVVASWKGAERLKSTGSEQTLGQNWEGTPWGRFQCGDFLFLPSSGSCSLQMRLTFQVWLGGWWQPEQKWRRWKEVSDGGRSWQVGFRQVKMKAPGDVLVEIVVRKRDLLLCWRPAF